ncbi:hypothetical protein BDF20DRAFT_832307 [Mycotypha africana]|uniref:uncharacterized protein n=1 Tax=Mycotypha africana TaxID=64632 RepID=UPI002300CF30|nr:uncharacterized protein BDF20DRAFT_832307 [Mycotypha africana]KAI8987364.1 hypothetical protein BDF20DRAFT_832307 [Mycotypha africana]
MKQTSNNSSTTLLRRRRSFRKWLKRVTLPNDGGNAFINDKIPHGGVFSVPLTTSIKYAQTSIGYVDNEGVKHPKSGAIPTVVAKCGAFLKKNGLHVEGIFRVSGNQKRINALEFIFNQSQSNFGLDLNWDGYTVHDAASILRRYLNKLPEPVIPLAYYQQFRDVMNDRTHNSTEDRIRACQELIHKLPTAHQHLLLYLLDTLSLFASFAEKTKMSITNLSSVFCPAILRHPNHNTPLDYKISQYVIEFLIEFQSLFTMQLFLSSTQLGNNSINCNFKSREETKNAKDNAFSLNSDHAQVKGHGLPFLIPYEETDQNTKLQKSFSNLDPFISPTIEAKSHSNLNISPVAIRLPTEINNNSKSVQKQNTRALLPLSGNYTAAAKTLDNVRHSFLRLTLELKVKFKDFSIASSKRFAPVDYVRLLLRRYTKQSASSFAGKVVYYVTLTSISLVIAYEVYLAIVSVHILEPFVFFTGLACYWTILYNGVIVNTNSTSRLSFFSTNTTPAVLLSSTIITDSSDNTEEFEMKQQHEAEGESKQSHTDIIDDKQGENVVKYKEENADPYSIDNVNDPLLLQDKSIMLEWHGLLTRAWRAKCNSNDIINQSAVSVIPDGDDNASILSKCSRFDEEEPSFWSTNKDDGEEEEVNLEGLEIDAKTLERYLGIYNQIKNDAQMAQRLQWEEDYARDKHNPFLSTTKKIKHIHDLGEPWKSDDDDYQESDDADAEVTTPTGVEKEEWKIRIFTH